MRSLVMLAVGLALAAVVIHAQTKGAPQPYKVVFDLTSDDPAVQGAVIRWLGEISAANPQTEMEVVMYGRGPALVVSGKTNAADDVKAALARGHVAFKVCEIAMKNQKIDPSQLLPGVGTVPDGIGEIVSKQTHGWGYIKAAH